MPNKSKVEKLTDFSENEKITQGKMAENFLIKVWLETIQNIVGEQGLNSILSYAHLEKYIDNFPPGNGKCETPTEDAQALFLTLHELQMCSKF